jgi:hypothetical protein
MREVVLTIQIYSFGGYPHLVEYPPEGLSLRVVLKIFFLHCNGQAVGGHKPFKETFDLG